MEPSLTTQISTPVIATPVTTTITQATMINYNELVQVYVNVIIYIN